MSPRLGIATLLYSTDYLPGVFTLGHQLHKLFGDGRSIKICLVVTKLLYEADLSELSRRILCQLFDEIIEVDPLADEAFCISQNSSNLSLLQRPELAASLIKSRLWELTQFDKVLYLDADTLPLNSNFINIFDVIPHQTSSQIVGSPDIGWPDMFNTGVLVLVPDKELAVQLQTFISDHISIDGADQGIFNQFFNPCCLPSGIDPVVNGNQWVRLPFLYNVTMPNYGYQSSPAMKYFEPQIKLVHFVGENKPWKGWSQTNVNGYSTRWYNVYKEFQREYQLTKCFEEMSVQEKPEERAWEPPTNYQQDYKRVQSTEKSRGNSQPVAAGDRSVSGISCISGISVIANDMSERTFPRQLEFPLNQTKPSGTDHEEQGDHIHYSEPERSFPEEIVKSGIVNIDSDSAAKDVVIKQNSENTERVSSQKTVSQPECVRPSDVAERTFPEETNLFHQNNGTENASRDLSHEGKAPITNSGVVLLDNSPPKSSAIEQELAHIRGDQEEALPTRLFDWEDTNYRAKVERSFPE